MVKKRDVKFRKNHLTDAAAAFPSEAIIADLVVMLDAGGTLVAKFDKLSHQLGFLTRVLPSSSFIAKCLEMRHPIAFVCGDIERGATLVPYIFNVIYSYHPGLPVLLSTANDPTILAILDKSRKRWPLANLVHLSKSAPHDILCFLASAMRRNGTFGLMQI